MDLFKILFEELLEESAKTDFIDKFGQEKLDIFDKAKQRMKNKNLSVDYQSYLKMSPEELDDFILSLYDKEKDAQKKRILQGTDKKIRGKYNYLGRYGDYEVYEPLDYISSVDLGVNTGWCTSGRYRHYGHPEFAPSEADAKSHWEEYYIRRGVKFVYLLNLQTMYGEIAIAIYPKILYVNRQVDQGDKIINLISTNFEIYDDKDNLNYSLLNKIPKQITDKFGLEINYTVAADFSNVKEINLESVAEIECDLLDIREVKKVPVNIRSYSGEWWLRSPGYNSILAAFVYFDGSVSNFGDCVYLDYFAVRPALHISNLDSFNLQIYKDSIKVFDKYWVYIGNNKVLLRGEPVTKMAFRQDWKAEDANVYEKSDIKKYLNQ